MGNVSDAVKRGLCSGCGICAGVVPCGSVSMSVTRKGDYEPRVADCHDCGLCLSICPMQNQPVDLVLASPLGEFVATYVGYSKTDDERAQGASGGMVTRVLKALLAEGLIDGAVSVVPSGDPSPLFSPALLRTQDEIASAARSKYYPVEFSGVLREISNTEGRFAFVGLPCVINGLRLAQERFLWLRERVRYLLGLTCGHTVSTRYTDFLAYCSGIAPERLCRAEYRIKDATVRASDFTFQAWDRDGRAGRRLGFQGSAWVHLVWGSGLLSPQACFLCVDTFACQADASFMDAWLPEYSVDPRGHSILVVRNPELLCVIEDEIRSGRVCLEELAPERVLASQGGLVARKMSAARLLSTPRTQYTWRIWVQAIQTWHWRKRAELSKVILGVGGRAGYRWLGLWLWSWRVSRSARAAARRLVRWMVRLGKLPSGQARGAARRRE